MKFIFYSISLSFCLAVIDSSLISELQESLLEYFKTQDNLTEYDPLDQSHYLNEDPHSTDKDNQSLDKSNYLNKDLRSKGKDSHPLDKSHYLNEDSRSKGKDSHPLDKSHYLNEDPHSTDKDSHPLDKSYNLNEGPHSKDEDNHPVDKRHDLNKDPRSKGKDIHPLDKSHYLNEDSRSKGIDSHHLDKSHYLNEDPHSTDKDSQPLDKSHYLNIEPHRKDKDSQYNKHTKLPRFTPRHKKDLAGTNSDRIRQMKKQVKWGKKYPYHNDEVNPKQALEEEGDRHNDIKEVNSDVAKAKIKTQLLHQFKKSYLTKEAPIISRSANSGIRSEQYLFFKDPVLNSLRKQFKKANFRRNHDPDDSLLKTSSSLELNDSKEEFQKLWLHKKHEALNRSSINRGDKVNMVAARPWGVPCGDPNQNAMHDMPMGVCTLPAECEAELRISRGDVFCKRTQLICCAYQILTYDTNHAFDISLDGKSASTGSDEKKERMLSSKEVKKRKRTADRKKRQKERYRRKKRIRKQIKKITHEIKKILNKQNLNNTKKREKRTNQLKLFIKDLKNQFKKDRQSVKDLHDNDMLTINTKFMGKLKQLMGINKNFILNSTFRDIVLKGTISKKVARTLLETYPELEEMMEARRAGGGEASPIGGGGTRRSGGGLASNDYKSDSDVLEYDVEYGYLYY